jgi:hypothetical protein
MLLSYLTLLWEPRGVCVEGGGGRTALTSQNKLRVSAAADCETGEK